MMKLAPEWVRTSNPVIRSPARYRWTTAPAPWWYVVRGLFPEGFMRLDGLIEKTRAANIIMFALPPHTTHWLNPLDKTV